MSLWELSKENIQPLPQGRKMANLNAALSSDPESEEALVVQKQKFEIELRSYQGDDPLDVYYRYIKWIQQSYPKNGKEGGLLELIKQALLRHSDNDVYRNDTRLVDIWMIYANITNSASEVYEYMHDHGIGTKVASFYKSWAYLMECMDNCKKTDSILVEGIREEAHPVEELIAYHRKYQERLVKKIQNNADNTSTSRSPERQRKVLGQLKTHGKSHMAPVSRVGWFVVNGNPQPLHQQTSSTPFNECENNVATNFKIFTGDDNGSQQNIAVTNRNDSKIKVLPESSARAKENTTKAGPWNKVKIKSKWKPATADSSAPVHLPKPSFTVHQDEEDGCCAALPQKARSTFTRALSDKKEDYVTPVAFFEPFDPTKKPMYNKFKVYGGAEEMSFEEIRAIRYLQKKKELEKEKDLVEKYQKMEQELDQKNLLLNKLLKNANQNCSNNSSYLSQQRSTDTIPSSEFQQDSSVAQKHELKSSENENRSENVQNLSDHARSSSEYNSIASEQFPSNTSTLKLRFSDDSASDIENKLSRVAIKRSEDSAFNQSSFNNLSNTSSENRFVDTCNRSSENGPIAPSPNHTEMSIMRELLNGSLAIDHSGSTSIEAQNADDETDAIFLNSHRPARMEANEEHVEQPFTIYTDDTSLLKDKLYVNECEEKDKLTDQNKENCSPPGTCKPPVRNRMLNGILEPVTDYPGSDIVNDKVYVNECEEKDKLTDQNKENCSPPGTCKPPVRNRMLNGILEPVTDYPGSDIVNDKVYVNECEEKDKLTDQNKENCSPPGTCKPPVRNRMLNGILEPATDYPGSDIVNDGDAFHVEMDYYEEYQSAADNRMDFQLQHINSDKAIELATKSSSDATLGSEANWNNISGSNRLTSTSLEVLGHSACIAENNNLKSNVNLSDIMELSRECCSRSSSSSSSSTYYSSGHASGLHAQSTTMSTSKHTLFSTIHEDEVPDDVECCQKKYSVNEVEDPFDIELIHHLLTKVSDLSARPGYQRIKEDIDNIRCRSTAYNMGRDSYIIQERVTDGAYAIIYLSQKIDKELCNDGIAVALKVEQPPCYWEYYICTELKNRLQTVCSNGNDNVIYSVMTITDAYFFNNRSLLVTEYHPHGTVLALANNRIPITYATFLTTQLLYIMEKVHACNIIHADIKPDNVLFTSKPSMDDINCNMFGENRKFNIKLIDFGRSIDMRLFPSDTSFTKVITTDKFTCTEMMDGKPWTYQTDFYGILAIIHTLLFTKYMDVHKNDAGKWKLKTPLKRYCFGRDIWEEMFNDLLNITDCRHIPDLSIYRKQLESFLLRPDNLKKLREAVKDVT